VRSPAGIDPFYGEGGRRCCYGCPTPANDVVRGATKACEKAKGAICPVYQFNAVRVLKREHVAKV